MSANWSWYLGLCHMHTKNHENCSQIECFMSQKPFWGYDQVLINLYMTQSKIPWPVGGHLSEKNLVTYLSGLDFCGRPYKLNIPSIFWIVSFRISFHMVKLIISIEHQKNRSKTVILSVILKFKQLQNVNLIETCSCYRRSENWICKYLMSR